MDRHVDKFIGAIILCALSGCANQHAVYRTFDASSEKPKSVVLDVKERAILVKNTKHGGIKVCAEPSPDALSVIGTSLAGSASDKSLTALQAVAGTSESGAFVGLRTTAIQLLQYEMYRNCESEFNGDLSPPEVADLHRRDQNVMTGLLAIEQLTGAVATRPVTLSQTTAAGTGDDISKQEDRLNARQKTLADDQKKLSEAQQKVDDQSALIEQDKQDVAAAQSALNAAAAADTQAKQTALNARTATQEKDEATQQTMQDDLDKQKAIVTADTDAVKNAQAALSAAQLRVHASSDENSQIAQAISANKPDPATVQAVASAVRYIVHDVISTSFSEESCLQYFQSVSEDKKKYVLAMNNYCTALLHQSELKIHLENMTLHEKLDQAH